MYILLACLTLSVAQKISKHETVLFNLNFDVILSQSAGILAPPQSVNITINEVTIINCTAVATYIHWEVNHVSVLVYSNKGIIQSETVTHDAVQNLRTRKLWVTGSPDSDGARIVCVVTLFNSDDSHQTISSEPALVLVQGL